MTAAQLAAANGFLAWAIPAAMLLFVAVMALAHVNRR
jgi:hypothetical protein